MDIESSKIDEIDQEAVPQQFLNELLKAANAYNVDISTDPNSYKEAINGTDSQNWQKAMEREIQELKDQKTWTLTKLPSNRKALKGRWVYKTKTNPYGAILRYKARYVVKGYLQQFGIDYSDTFANTIRPNIYRALFYLTAEKDWEIHQWDVKSAFNTAKIDEEIYVEQPIGFIKDKQLVCKLNKSLYGLKQSARNWQQYLISEFQRIGFKELPNDPSIFVKNGIIVIIYIDDMIVIGENTTIIDETRAKLGTQMELTNLGIARVFVGVEIIRDRSKRSITLSQKGYTAKILDKFAKGIPPKINPCAQGIRLEPNKEKANSEEIQLFQQQIGSLMYLMTATRPDLSFPIGQLARFMSNPHKTHLKALKRVWEYL